MADIVDRKKRSEMMSRIRSRNTKPEFAVRRALRHQRIGFQCHPKHVAGSPDIVLTKKQWNTVIFAHGCFWHRHAGCKMAYSVKSNVEAWNRKFQANEARDRNAYTALAEAGRRVIVVWECATRKLSAEDLGEQILDALRKGADFAEIPNPDDAVSSRNP